MNNPIGIIKNWFPPQEDNPKAKKQGDDSSEEASVHIEASMPKKLAPKKKKECKVYYFKPETYMMQKPEQQRLFREKLIN